jgi:hypothetical protein
MGFSAGLASLMLTPIAVLKRVVAIVKAANFSMGSLVKRMVVIHILVGIFRISGVLPKLQPQIIGDCQIAAVSNGES